MSKDKRLTPIIHSVSKVISPLLLMSAFVTSSVGSTNAMTAESQKLIDEMVVNVEKTMNIVSVIESNAGNNIGDLHVLLSIPARMSASVGMVLDINDDDGYRVLSTSPRGFASTVGLNAEDTLVAINGMDTKTDNRRDAFTVLENAIAGDTLRFDVMRENSMLQLEGELEGVYTPQIKIELGGKEDAVTDTSSPTVKSEQATKVDDDACGQVSTFFKPPRTRDLYSVYVSEINDDNVLRSRTTFKLAPGKHKIDVHELIDSTRFTRRSMAIQRAKPITIDVEENVVYYLAARFIPENRQKQRKGEYWEPVVWKTTEDRACSL